MTCRNYRMPLKFLDVCNIIGCRAYAIEQNRVKFNKVSDYWLPLCARHQLAWERMKYIENRNSRQ